MISKLLTALVQTDTPLGEAEELLHGSVPAPKPVLDGQEQMRTDRREWLEARFIPTIHEHAQETRLRRWLGWDLAPPVDVD